MKNFDYHALRSLRRSHGYTQAEVAEKLNISRTTYCDYERGRILPPISRIRDIADLYNTTIFEFLDNDKKCSSKTYGSLQKISYEIRMLDITENEKDALLNLITIIMLRYEERDTK